MDVESDIDVPALTGEEDDAMAGRAAAGSGSASSSSPPVNPSASSSGAPSTERPTVAPVSEPRTREEILAQHENLSDDDEDMAPVDEQEPEAVAEVERSKKRKSVRDTAATAGGGAAEDMRCFDVSKALKSLCHSDPVVVEHALQRLHVRWYHATEAQMTPILKANHCPGSALKLVKPVIAKCMVCRDWHRPGPHNVATTKISLEFNEEVQMDLMFYKSIMHPGPKDHQLILCHLVDSCIRWDMCNVIASKTSEAMTSCITLHWIALFTPMRVLVSDGESGMRSREAADWASAHRIHLKFKAPDQKAWVVERHHEI